ncbi:MAG: ABC transporter permease [Gemmatimonadota bacterium]
MLRRDVLQDAKLALRTFVSRPGYALLVVFTLGLGIGATSAVFSVVNAVLIQPLPYDNPDQLVFIWHESDKMGFEAAPVPGPDVIDYREQTTVFEEIAALNNTPTANLTGAGEPVEIHLSTVTANYFDVLGVPPELGRTFIAADGEREGTNNVVISHQLWSERFEGADDVIGSEIAINGAPRTVVGVMPPTFEVLMPAAAGMSTDIDVWRTFDFDLADLPRDNAFLRVVARLRDGATLEQANDEVAAVVERQRELFEYHGDRELRSTVRPLHSDIVSHVDAALLSLLGAVLFVLLIACANVANLLLARAVARERELAIRASLGGSPGRIVRQLLTESAFFALIGGLLGLLLARWGIDLLLAVRPASLPRLEHVPLDGTVLLATAAVTAVAALLFGSLPAFQALRPDLRSSLTERGTVTPTPPGRKLRSALVVTEVALSMVLLVGAGLMVRSFADLTKQELGFTPDSVHTFRVTLTASQYPTSEDRDRFLRKVTESLEADPAIERAGAVFPLPLSGRFWTGPWMVKGQQPEAGLNNEANYRLVMPGYFETMRTPLLKGRSFAAEDSRRNLPVAVIDRTMADMAFPGGDPIGKRLRIQRLGSDDMSKVRVIGVVENIRHRDLSFDGRATIYYPYRAQAFGNMALVVRTSGPAAEAMAAIDEAVYALDPNMPAAAKRPMAAYVAEAMDTTRFTMFLILALAGIAVVLASIGLYGVLFSAVRNQTRELGVHMAFGASSSQILRGVVARGLKLAAAGILIGIVASILLTRPIVGLLSGVSATDPVTFVVVTLLLGFIAALASYFPARRALRVEPTVALRHE